MFTLLTPRVHCEQHWVLPNCQSHCLPRTIEQTFVCPCRKYAFSIGISIIDSDLGTSEKRPYKTFGRFQNRGLSFQWSGPSWPFFWMKWVGVCKKCINIPHFLCPSLKTYERHCHGGLLLLPHKRSNHIPELPRTAVLLGSLLWGWGIISNQLLANARF